MPLPTARCLPYLDTDLPAPAAHQLTPLLSNTLELHWQANGSARLTPTGTESLETPMPPECARELAYWLHKTLWLNEIGETRHFEEILRLALAANEKSIAAEMADALATEALNTGNYSLAREYCVRGLSPGEDFALLHTLGLAEAGLGDEKQAIAHMERALSLSPTTQDDPAQAGETASLMSHLATLHARAGAAFRAYHLLEKAREHYAQAQNQQGEADTLTQIGLLMATQHDLRAARQHLEEARALYHSIGDGVGEASALRQLARLLEGRNKNEWSKEAEQFSAEALRLLAENAQWEDLSRLLLKLGQAQKNRTLLLQSLWIALQIAPRPDLLSNLRASLLMTADDKRLQESPYIAAATLSHIEQAPRDFPRHAEIHRLAIIELISCARENGVDENHVRTWMNDLALNPEQGVIQKTLRVIEDAVKKNDWAFDNRLMTG